MNLMDFQKMLLPFQKRLNRLKLIDSIRKTVNQTSYFALCVSISMIIMNLIFSGFLKYRMPGSWMPAGFVLIMLYMIISAVLNSRENTGWKLVVSRLDELSNKHNLIATAYEFVECQRDSAFARIMILEGIARLKTVKTEMLEAEKCRLKITIPAAVFLLLTACVLNSPLVVLSQATSQVILLEKVHDTSAPGLPASGIKISDNSLPGTIHTQVSIESFKRSNPVSPDYSSQSGISSSQLSDSTSSNSKSSSGKPGSSVCYSRKSSEILKNKGSGISGNALAPPGETSIKSGFLNTNAGLQEDQSDAKIKDKNSLNAFSNSSRRPFLDDKRSAPGRELGRSGRKGRPGDGRGGPGSVKKSRSTASIFPGDKITVHVKSSPGKGKSKSFLSNTPLQKSQGIEKNTLLSYKSNEGRIDKYFIKEHLRTVTRQYFEELNSYANRVLKEGPKKD